jgi:lipopolysaccharide export system protein LptA
MAASIPDRTRLFMLALLCAGMALTAHGADQKTAIDIVGGKFESDLNTGKASIRDIVISQGSSLLISAENAFARDMVGGYENGEWELRGKVHMEFEGVTVDAESAVVKLAFDHVSEAHIRGTPATFSHLPVGSSARNQGRAETVDYDVKTGDLKLLGKIWFADGRNGNEMNPKTLTYSLKDQRYSGDGVRMILRGRDGLMPPPRMPDRSTAK